MQREEMDIGLFLNTPVFFDIDEGYSADYLNLVDFALEFAHSINSLTLFLPVREGESGAVPFNLPNNVEIVHFPYYNGPFDLLRKSHRIVPKLIQLSLSRSLNELDSIGVVAPSTIGTTVAPLLYLQGKPNFLIMRGDKRKTVTHSYDEKGPKKVFLQSVIRFYDWSTRQMLSSQRTILFVFGDLREELAEYGYDVEKVRIITPLIPANIITKKRAKVSDTADILYVGRLAGEKGLYDLIEAFNRLLESGVSAHLHFVGDGPESEDLHKWTTEFGIKEHVTFHGFVPRGDQLWSKYDKADVFVLPSYTEGFPRVIGEAMARGLPIVTTNVGGIPELIVSYRNGLIIEPRSPNELAEQLELVIQDRQLYAKLSKNAIETARQLTFEHEADVVITEISNSL